MSFNLPYRVRAVLYITTGVVSPVMAYLLARGYITELEMSLWLAEVTFVSALAAFNTTPTKGEEE